MILGDENPWMVVRTGVFTSRRVGQRHEVVMAMDEIELRSVFEGFGDMQIFGDLGIDGAILFIARGRLRRAGGRASPNPWWRTK